MGLSLCQSSRLFCQVRLLQTLTAFSSGSLSLYPTPKQFYHVYCRLLPVIKFVLRFLFHIRWVFFFFFLASCVLRTWKKNNCSDHRCGSPLSGFEQVHGDTNLNVSDGLPVGPDRDGLEKLMHLCLNKAERSVVYLSCLSVLTVVEVYSFCMPLQNVS